MWLKYSDYFCLRALQSSLLQRHQDQRVGPPEDGDARPLRRNLGSHGPPDRKSRREHDDRDGLLCSARRGNRDSRQRPGPGLRVHDGVHGQGEERESTHLTGGFEKRVVVDTMMVNSQCLTIV